MLIAGIDEAGLGPALGVLCVAGAAVRVAENSLTSSRFVASPEDLKKIYADIFSADKKSNLPLLTDSKIVYTARGLAGLELPVLAVARHLNFSFSTRANFLADLANDEGENLNAELNSIAWYQNAPWQFPVATSAEKIAALAPVLTKITAAPFVALSARIFTARQMNEFFARGEKKSAVAWRLVGALIKHFVVLAQAADESALIIIDKQGGRNFYAPLLAALFACPLLATLRETPELSEYRSGKTLIRFVVRGEQHSLPTALASMTAKYLRERLMQDFNAWFAARITDLKPTAGYHGDAPRFAAAVADCLRENKIPPAYFWRQR